MAKNKANAQPNDFNVALEGNLKGISIPLLTNTLQNINTLVQEIGLATTGTPDLAVQIKTFKPGGFDVVLSVAHDPSLNNSLFGEVNAANAPDGAKIINTLSEVLAIREFVGAKKPKNVKQQDDSLIIKNSAGKTKSVNAKVGEIALYNPVVSVTINNTFNALKQEGDVEGLVLKDHQGKKQFKAKRSSFKVLAGSNPLIQKKSKSVNNLNRNATSLSIFKLVFGKKKSWEFYYEGNKISANIEDEGFIKRMLTGKIEFKNGDIMVADLDILQVFNEAARVYENRKYTITKVHEIKHTAYQSEMGFEA